MTTFQSTVELAARIHVFIFLSLYGTGKIMGGQFYRKGALPPEIAEQTLAEVSSFDLAWTFMGHSFAYICWIGGFQILGACCLLFERTKYIGIAILMPILFNIILFDAIFFDTEPLGALASAVIYFLLLMLILWLNGEKTKTLLQLLIQSMTPSQKTPKTRLPIALGLVAILFFMEQCLVRWLGI